MSRVSETVLLNILCFYFAINIFSSCNTNPQAKLKGKWQGDRIVNTRNFTETSLKSFSYEFFSDKRYILFKRESGEEFEKEIERGSYQFIESNHIVIAPDIDSRTGKQPIEEEITQSFTYEIEIKDDELMLFHPVNGMTKALIELELKGLPENKQKQIIKAIGTKEFYKKVNREKIVEAEKEFRHEINGIWRPEKGGNVYFEFRSDGTFTWRGNVWDVYGTFKIKGQMVEILELQKPMQWQGEIPPNSDIFVLTDFPKTLEFEQDYLLYIGPISKRQIKYYKSMR